MMRKKINNIQRETVVKDSPHWLKICEVMEIYNSFLSRNLWKFEKKIEGSKKPGNSTFPATMFMLVINLQNIKAYK